MSFTGDRTNDIRVIGVMLVILLLIIALIGLDWEALVFPPSLTTHTPLTHTHTHAHTHCVDSDIAPLHSTGGHY